MAEEGIVGVKKSEYRDPAEILGAPLSEGDLPSDVKFFLKQKKSAPGGVQKVVTLYELIREPGALKLRMDPLEKYQNRIPEDTEVALEFGPSPEGYKWIAKWEDDRGNIVGVESDIIRVSEKWRERHDAHKRRRKTEAESSAMPAAVSAPAGAPAQGMSARDLLELMNAGRRSALEDMERMASLMKATQSETPASVMEKMWDSMGGVMEKFMESQMSIVKRVKESSLKAMDRADAELDGDEGDDEAEAAAAAEGGPASGIPAFLEPFLPKIQEYLGTLLGGGPVGAAVKTVILSTKEWKEIFADKEKFGQAQEAMISEFGEDKTRKALDILLNRRPEKKARK